MNRNVDLVSLEVFKVRNKMGLMRNTTGVNYYTTEHIKPFLRF